MHSVAQAVAVAFPAHVEEVLLPGSVSRGVADELSDVELLVVTAEELDLGTCFALAAASGLEDVATWGREDAATRRVPGRREGVPVELIWWARAAAESAVDAVFDGGVSATAEANANGAALRTAGSIARWQERLRHHPGELATAQIEQAALK